MNCQAVATTAVNRLFAGRRVLRAVSVPPVFGLLIAGVRIQQY